MSYQTWMLSSEPVHTILTRLCIERVWEPEEPDMMWNADRSVYALVRGVHDIVAPPGARSFIEFVDFTGGELPTAQYVELYHDYLRPHLGDIRWLTNELDPKPCAEPGPLRRPS